MPVECTLPFAIQITTIVASMLGIIFALVLVFDDANFGGVIFYAFIMFSCLLVILSEIYVVTLMRYVAFILTIWGKGMMFLFLGFFEFRAEGVGLAAAIIFWLLFIVYVTLFFVVGSTAPPLLQKQTPPQFETSEADYYSGEHAGDTQPATTVGLAEDAMVAEAAVARESAAESETALAPAPVQRLSGEVALGQDDVDNPFA
jgi:hypothetical protein